MKRNNVFVIIISLTLFLGAGATWLVFTRESTAKIPLQPLLTVLFVLAASAIYPLYRLEKLWPSFASGIRLVLASLSLTLCSMAGPWIGLSGIWTELVQDVGEALFVIGMLILVWKAVTKKGQPNSQRE